MRSKTQNETQELSNKRFYNAKPHFGQNLVTSFLPHQLQTCQNNSRRLTIDEPVLWCNDKNRTQFQKSKSKLYTITLIITVFYLNYLKETNLKIKNSCSDCVKIIEKYLQGSDFLIDLSTCNLGLYKKTNSLLALFKDYVHMYPTAILQKTSQKGYCFEYMNLYYGLLFFENFLLIPYPNLYGKCCLV